MSATALLLCSTLLATPPTAGAPTLPRVPGPQGPARPGDAPPVVRAVEGDWGMFFRFGGLASLLASSNTRTVSGLMIQQVGLRKVLDEESIIPFFLGAGYRVIAPDGVGEASNDWGLDLGVGYEHHFRIWRRISPFIAFNAGIGLVDPEGDSNTVFGIGFGPSMGIEYYIADRVSLIAQYLVTLQVDISPDNFSGFQFTTLAGGAMNLNVYF